MNTPIPFSLTSTKKQPHRPTQTPTATSDQLKLFAVKTSPEAAAPPAAEHRKRPQPQKLQKPLLPAGRPFSTSSDSCILHDFPSPQTPLGVATWLVPIPTHFMRRYPPANRLKSTPDPSSFYSEISPRDLRIYCKNCKNPAPKCNDLAINRFQALIPCVLRP